MSQFCTHFKTPQVKTDPALKTHTGQVRSGSKPAKKPVGPGQEVKFDLALHFPLRDRGDDVFLWDSEKVTRREKNPLWGPELILEMPSAAPGVFRMLLALDVRVLK